MAALRGEATENVQVAAGLRTESAPPISRGQYVPTRSESGASGSIPGGKAKADFSNNDANDDYD